MLGALRMKLHDNRLSPSKCFVALAVVASVAAGCSVDERAGALDNATFAYRSSRGCAQVLGPGCPVTGALLVGVHEVLEVKVSTGDDPRGDLALVSESPGVMTVGALGTPSTGSGQRTYQFRLNALSRGAAVLTLRRGDGGVVDRVTVRAEEAATLEIVNEDATQGTLSPDGTRLTVHIGNVGSITGYARDANGQRLHGNDAIQWELDNRNYAELSFGFVTGARVDDDHVYVNARAPGLAHATVRAGGVRRELEVYVVP